MLLWKQTSHHLWIEDFDCINLAIKFWYWSCSDTQCNWKNLVFGPETVKKNILKTIIWMLVKISTCYIAFIILWLVEKILSVSLLDLSSNVPNPIILFLGAFRGNNWQYWWSQVEVTVFESIDSCVAWWVQESDCGSGADREQCSWPGAAADEAGWVETFRTGWARDRHAGQGRATH